MVAIRIYKSALSEEAKATAASIGKVVVDHGDTACKAPDATTTSRGPWRAKGKGKALEDRRGGRTVHKAHVILTLTALLPGDPGVS